MSQTAAVLATTSSLPLHLRAKSTLSDEAVSSRSRWSDRKWVLDNLTKGSRANRSTINWRIELREGVWLTDAPFVNLLDTMKRFVWSLMAAPREGAHPLSPGSMGPLRAGIAFFLQWMFGCGYETLGEVDSAALDRFRTELPDLLVERSAKRISPEEISVSTVSRVVTIPVRLWQQRAELQRAGVQTLPELPWEGLAPGALAEEIATKAIGQIPPVPDEVAIPIMTSAYRMIGVPAKDVVRLQEAYLKAYDTTASSELQFSPHTKRSQAVQESRRVVERFVFSKVSGEEAPWHDTIYPEIQISPSGAALRMSSARLLRQLIMDVRDAAVLVIQATAGMRISEICGLPAGLNRRTGLPSCVKVEVSYSGLHEMFLVRTPLSKTEAVPRDAEWVLGMRLRGDGTLPPPVEALLILQKLWEPWRKLGKSNDLITGFANRNGLPKSSRSISKITADSLRNGSRQFIARYVNLTHLKDTSARAVEPGDLVEYRKTKGQCIKTHQWRKTTAHFVFNTDNQLIPALAMQFQHISLAMTEQGYLGKNVIFLDAADSIRLQETTSLIYEVLYGKSQVAGRMADQIREHGDQVRIAVADAVGMAAWRRIFHFVVEKGLKIWFTPHGKCLPIKPRAMRCHQIAGTQPNFAREPNYATREPSVCAGCSCFALDGRHVEFWKARYARYWLAWKEAQSNGQTEGFRVVKERALQSRALLHALGVDTEASLLGER